ncbi:hypothetical protein [Helicobacter kayseriensis]|uniref:hypothetical protein n=1 Tax=Helicobacter kayseriensis TaxID=2905877 RepID=UPI001E419753|nr:hypothetical protein [Helicobacter kayseriensis]MCE3047176.1 hypothetical protein [Helicobacter kayseriensis]MCE3048547.1 hypothetical protein [Helicobacter kayseriensis]
MSPRVFYIAQGGKKGALILLGLCIFSAILSFEFLACLFLILFALWVFAFRNPERLATHLSENIFLAPADGKIVEICAKGDKTKVVIEVGAMNVGVLRSPIAIKNYQLSKSCGVPLFFSKKRDFFSPVSSLSFLGHSICITQNLFRIEPFYSQGEFERGERMGFVKAGRVEMQIQKIELKVNVGDRIKGGESVIGYLNEN